MEWAYEPDFRLTGRTENCCLSVKLFVFSEHVHVHYMSSSVRPSVCLSVCNVCAPYLGD